MAGNPFHHMPGSSKDDTELEISAEMADRTLAFEGGAIKEDPSVKDVFVHWKQQKFQRHKTPGIQDKAAYDRAIREEMERQDEERMLRMKMRAQQQANNKK